MTYFNNYARMYGEEAATEKLTVAREAVDTVIDYCDKDLAYNPVSILGLVLSPELLNSFLSFIGTVIFGYF